MALEHPQWGPWRKTILTGEWVKGKISLGGTEGRRGRRWQADSGLGFLFLSNCSPLSKRVAVKRISLCSHLLLLVTDEKASLGGGWNLKLSSRDLDCYTEAGGTQRK